MQGIDDRVTVVMDRACRDEDVGRAVKRRGRGVLKHRGPIPQPRPQDIDV